MAIKTPSFLETTTIGWENVLRGQALVVVMSHEYLKT